jgi:negative regulator of flagellin synthesis FlgM
MVGVTPTNITRLRLAGDVDTQRAASGAAGHPTAGAVATPATGATGADSLRLSDQAMSLSQGMLKTPPIDRALVDRLGTAIAEGRYPVDPERIAQAMFADSFDLQT